MYKPTDCPYCRADLAQPVSGRTRRVCPSPDCQRKADADRRRQLRRRRAGIVRSWWGGSADRQPKGGRDPLVRRMAKALGAYRFRHVALAPEELVALDAAVRAGANRYAGRSWLAGLDLAPEVMRVLRTLAKRDREATPPPASRVIPGSGAPGDPTIVGTLPEPFERRGGRRGGGRIELPLPAKPRLIEL